MFERTEFAAPGSTRSGRYGRAAAGIAVTLLCLGLLGVITLVPRPALADSHVIYVDHRAEGNSDGSSWADAYTNLQVALQAATSGQEIWVAAGVYKPGTTRSATFQLKDGVALYGGFGGTEAQRDQRDWQRHKTILSGDLNGDDNGNVTRTEPTRQDNSYHVVSASDLNNTAILDGFSITGGNANIYESNSNFAGGGMHNDNSSPTLINVTFSGNSAHYGGGMSNRYSDPTLINVTFSGNSATYGAGMYNFQGHPTLINVTFSGNSANYGGGMFSRTNSRPTLVNVTFSGNSASDGGGMFNDDSSPTLINVTFSGNSASDEGGGMYNSGSLPALSNSILWGNEDVNGTGYSAQMHNNESTPSVRYSLVQGGLYSGIGNITGDPKFVRAPSDGGDGWGNANDDYGDLRLRHSSPAIDAGSNSPVPGDSNDLDGDGDTVEKVPYDLAGNPRILDHPEHDPDGSGALVDMGAYETFTFDLRLSQSATPLEVLPGERVSFTLQYINVGDLVAGDVVLTATLPVSLTAVTTSSAPEVEVIATDPHTWAVGDLAPGDEGKITVRGIVPEGLAAGTHLTTRAGIRTAVADVDPHNDSTTETVTVRNAPPQSRDDGATTVEETPINVAVLENDQDANHDTLTISGVGRPLHGTVAIDGSQLRYTPTLDFTGTDRFTYTVSDGSLTAQAVVTIDITEETGETEPAIFLPFLSR